MSGGIYTTDKTKTLQSLADVEMDNLLNNQAPVYDATLEVFTNQHVATSSGPITADLGDVIIGDGAGGITSTDILFVDTINSRVGIGTTTPTTNLHIQKAGEDNAIRIGQDAGGDDAYIWFNTNTDWSLGVDDSDGEKFKINNSGSPSGGATAITIDTNENVGIGTTSPSFKLDIADINTSATVNIRSSATIADGVGGKIILGQSSDGIAQIEGKFNGGTGGDNKDLLFYSGGNLGTAKMTLKGSGNVGIGTSTPSTILEIRDTRSQEAQINYAGGGGKDILRLVRNNTPGDPTSGVLGQLGFNVRDSDPQIYFDNDTVQFSMGLLDEDDSFRISNNAFVGTNDRLTISSTGSVGIGTVTPSSQLSVVGSGTGDTKILTIGNLEEDDTGDETSTAMFQLTRSYTNPVSLNDAGFIKVGKEKAWSSAGDRDSFLALGTRAGAVEPDEKMRITSIGNVGIGTNNPAVRLDVGTGSIRGAVEIVNQSTGAISSTNCYGDTIYADTAGGTLTLPAGVAGMNLQTINASGGAITLAVQTGEFLDDVLNGTDNLATSASKPFLHKYICGATGKWYVLD